MILQFAESTTTMVLYGVEGFMFKVSEHLIPTLSLIDYSASLDTEVKGAGAS